LAILLEKLRFIFNRLPAFLPVIAEQGESWK
jgi:hypothetical protein